MAARNRPSRPQIDEAIDPVDLFRQTERVFAGIFTVEQLVAADRERALFVGQQTAVKRRVALRIHYDPDAPGRRWFERETELLGQVDHPGIRPIYSAGYRERWAYRVSKWIDGESLEEAMQRGPRSLPDALQIARDLVSALEYVHRDGIVIRRIAPTALMLTRASRAIITDLRWANRLLDVTPPEASRAHLAFMAPETRDGRPGDPSADVYTAAALLYFAITGEEPALEAAAIPSPREVRPTCPEAIARVLMHALRPEPQRRYLTAAEMGTDLQSTLGVSEFEPVVEPSDAVGDPVEWEGRLRRALGDEYELLDELGAGGFGRVYRVRDLALERVVALKVLHPWLTTDPSVIERFRREARLAARGRHPNIVDVYDASGRSGLLWYTMAHIEGGNLDQLVERNGPLSPPLVGRLLMQSLAALDHAHAQGLVHRDLKPANILIELPAWEVKVTDFGLAIAFEGMAPAGGSPSRSGTPEFAAPEQLLGEPVDARADLYSLAIVAIFALLGRSPFRGGTPEAVLARQAAGRLPDLRTARPDLSAAARTILLRAAAHDPTNRYPTAAAFRDALEQSWPLDEERPVGWARRMLGRT